MPEPQAPANLVRERIQAFHTEIRAIKLQENALRRQLQRDFRRLDADERQRLRNQIGVLGQQRVALERQGNDLSGFLQSREIDEQAAQARADEFTAAGRAAFEESGQRSTRRARILRAEGNFDGANAVVQGGLRDFRLADTFTARPVTERRDTRDPARLAADADAALTTSRAERPALLRAARRLDETREPGPEPEPEAVDPHAALREENARLGLELENTRLTRFIEDASEPEAGDSHAALREENARLGLEIENARLIRALQDNRVSPERRLDARRADLGHELIDLNMTAEQLANTITSGAAAAERLAGDFSVNTRQDRSDAEAVARLFDDLESMRISAPTAYQQAIAVLEQEFTQRGILRPEDRGLLGTIGSFALEVGDTGLGTTGVVDLLSGGYYLRQNRAASDRGRSALLRLAELARGERTSVR